MKKSKRQLALFLAAALLAAGCSNPPQEPSPSYEPLDFGTLSPAPASSALQTLIATPERYERYLQLNLQDQTRYANLSSALLTDLHFDAQVCVPALEEVCQYRVIPEPVNVDLAAGALGGRPLPEEAKEAVNYLFNSYSDPDYSEEFGLRLNAHTRFGLELIDKAACYVGTPQNRSAGAQPAGCAITEDEAAALAEEAVKEMGLPLVLDRVEAFDPCPPETAALYDRRPPSENGFYEVYMVHTLQDMPVRRATGSVSRFESPEGADESYADSSAYTGLRFTVDGRGIRGLQGTLYHFQKVRPVSAILSLEEAVEELRSHTAAVNRFLSPHDPLVKKQSFQIEQISFEYVYDRFYPSAFLTELQVEPVWCFELKSGEKRYEIYVNALNGRLCFYTHQPPDILYPAEEDFF
ncbi:MAG: hypothetical protein HFG27_12750 [Provencibacterium sp.]|jgi:hypothetical protein|nr:hypothetical protein [Provencibacterium sp.]